ncbi:hypothetical protein [Pseudoalteromonas sp. 2CM36K]|uniref:hypothetical protein n=1 Tax=Pseudoalteromonas sp. 2CM36K TaxID=2929854 RepID=UPI0020BEE4CD|nr:hypothetical protein [Pseudoalteromonas sp. 2CM36K]MCK8104738.1 hypothetical protein [Pseudoalteromonas sp. 2CM36K]
MLWVLPEGHWQLVGVDNVEMTAIEAAGVLDEHEFPKFIHVTDGKNEKFFEMDFPPMEVDQIPSVNEINNYKQIKRDTTYYWSREMYQRLMDGLDDFHETVYTKTKDNVSNKNEIIEEVAKFLFLETFRIHHPDQQFKYEDKVLQFKDVFDWKYDEKNKADAVKQIKVAFDELKEHQDYKVTKAVAYLKVYRKVSGDDLWANTQMEKFRALGVM